MDNEIKFITSLNELERLINTGFKFSNELMDCYNNSKDNLELIKLVIKENQNNLMKMIDNYNKSIENTRDDLRLKVWNSKDEINNKIFEYKEKYKTRSILHKFISSIFKSLNKEMNNDYGNIQKLNSELLIIEEKYKTIDKFRCENNFKLNHFKKQIENFSIDNLDFLQYKTKLELINSFKNETILNKYEINSIFLELNKNLHSKFTDITTLFNQFNNNIENLQPHAITKVNAWMNEKVNSATNKDLSINIDPKIYSFNIGKASVKLSKNGVKAVLAALIINLGYNEIISPNTQSLLKNIQEISGGTTEFITSKIDEYYDKIINIPPKKNKELERN